MGTIYEKTKVFLSDLVKARLAWKLLYNKVEAEMRNKILVIISMMVIFLTPLLFAQEGYYRYQFARIQYVQGDVILQTAEGTEEAAEVNFVVAEGNVLMTREGRAEVYLGRGNELRLDNWTMVEFLSLPRSEREKTSFRISEGSIYLRLRNLDHEKAYEIHTADASFYVLEKGLYRFDVSPQDTQIIVLEGAGEVAGDERSVILERGERLLAARGDLGSTMRSFQEKDSFASWNEERDARDIKASSRYLPAELAEYEAELESHGRWVYERPWGYVWVPIVIYSDWRPYYYGRWVWYPMIGWTWVPYEPWGWCVFHFGRWHWRFGLGWYWIPTTCWGPAWVYWWSAYDYYGWVPLSYYNRPIVIVNNIFYDRYYDSVYPIYSRALTVVRKDQLMAPRIHEVALRENQIVSLSHLSLRAARTEELNSLVRANSLRSLTVSPSISRVRTGQTSATGENRVLKRENLKGVSGSPSSSPSNLNSRGGQSQVAPLRQKTESPQIRRIDSQGLKSGTTSQGRQIDSGERRIRTETGSLPGIRVNPAPVQPQKREGEGGPSTSIRKKDEESSRPSRLSSFSSTSERESGSANFSSRTSPVNYFRSKLAERSTNSSRNIRPSSPAPENRSNYSGTWRLPSVTKVPSVTSLPRVSVPSFSSNQRSFSPARISPPSVSSRPSTGSRPSTSAGGNIRKK